MNIRDLKYLVALIDHRHFGRAAEACFVSQPALSMQIKKLEENLGVRLLERTNKSVMLTAIGNEMGERARYVLQQVDEMRDLARSASDPFSGELHLGIFPTLAPYLLPHIMPALTENFPRLSLFLHEDKTAVLIEKLRMGKIDAALLALPVTEQGFISVELFNEEFLLAVPKSHSLANNKFIDQNELRDEQLLLLEDGHCLREQALTFCYQLNAKENQRFRATSLETLRHMIAAGIGITLMPKFACRKNDEIVYIPFKSSQPFRQIGMLSRASSARQQVIQEISTQIKLLIISK